ncbi:unnamed protein product [Fusarium graminearum]|nr:unnamed protein product [Fusarium graminearum]
MTFCYSINQTLAEHFSEYVAFGVSKLTAGPLFRNKEEIKEIRDVAQCWTETFPAAQPSDSIGTPSHKSQE